MLNAKHAEYVTYRLCKAGADNNPAVTFTVDDGLREVCDCGQCEKDCEEIGGTDIWAERPLSILIGESCIEGLSGDALEMLSCRHLP